MLNLSKTFSGLFATARRFPISVFCCFTYYLLWEDLYLGDRTQPLEDMLVIAFFWLGAAKVYGEAKGHGWLRSYAQAFIGFGIISLIYYLNYNGFTYAIMLYVSLLFVVIAPFVTGKTSDIHFYNYNRDVWMGFLYSVLLSIIFAIGTALIFETIRVLFGVRLSEISEELLQICFICIAPIFALSFVPTKFEEADETKIPKGLHFILSYIIVPLGLAYLLILYAYSAKIVLQWELPKGDLALYIALFGAAGSVIHLACHPLRNTGNLLVRIFSKYFCFSLLPLVAILFVAVGVRIEEYGVTYSRYILVLAGIWFMLTAANYIYKNDVSSMKFGAKLLTAMLLLATFGPWGAASISASSQLNRLEQLLTDNGLLKDGKILKAEDGIESKVNYEISSVIDYLKKIDKLEPAYGWTDAKVDAANTDRDLHAMLGIENKHSNHYRYEDRFNIYKPYNETSYQRLEKNFYILDSADFYCREKFSNERLYLFEEDGQEMQVSMHDNTLHIKINEKDFIKVDLIEIKKNADAKNYVYTSENDIGHISIMLERMVGEESEEGISIENLKVRIILKIK